MKYWVYIFSCILALLARPALADHLVGGDFRITALGNFEYEIQLNVYGDAAGLSTGNTDNFVDVSIFEKGTNQKIEAFQMPLVSNTGVPLQNTACQANTFQIRLLTYRVRKILFPAMYVNSNGYYLVWERCCRNIAVSNLVQPGFTGLVYYTEFPAVTQNNQPFVNSSPVLPPIPPEYLCVGDLYQYSMKSVDPDGDSLAYFLTSPMKGNTTKNSPFTNGDPGPYSLVDWASGYSANQMILGNPNLTLDSRTGMLSVRPRFAGLFVFALKVVEYRKGVKIGETFRDVQVKINNCPRNIDPSVSIRIPGAPRNYQPGDTLLVTDATDFCFPINFSDPDLGQVVSLKVVPLNFAKAPTVSPSQATVMQANQVFSATICWPDCNINSPNDLYYANLIVTDNACGDIGSDTLRLTFRIIPKPNAKPTIRTLNLPGNTATITVGQKLNFSLLSEDQPDNDALTVRMLGIGFDPVALGMSLKPVTGQGSVTSEFEWTTSCSDFNTRDIYKVQFRVRDNSCYPDHEDSVTVTLRLVDVASETNKFLPPNIFTPNGDGFNDRFELGNLPADNCSDNFEELIIYNRWGTKVFTTKDRFASWDGKHVSDGVYFYQIKFRKKLYKGTITIVK